MSKTILITGSTDGIGLETAKMLLEKGHHVLLHGRTPKKLEAVAAELSNLGNVETYVADLSDMSDVLAFAKAVVDRHEKLDVLINNAGVLKTSDTVTKDGLDVRFAVNTIAPYLLTNKLLPLLGESGRVVNVSSAAQAPVELEALTGKRTNLPAMDAYAQSKLAITMWTRTMAESLKDKNTVIVAVNPGSLLGSKMVKEGFGTEGKDLSIGANILTRAAFSDEFSDASGKYFDNDSGQFANPHPDALDQKKCLEVEDVIKTTIRSL